GACGAVAAPPRRRRSLGPVLPARPRPLCLAVRPLRAVPVGKIVTVPISALYDAEVAHVVSCLLAWIREKVGDLAGFPVQPTLL
ncbi:MAG: hypothetical protein IJ783_10710, partial [Kiritimatiellae bacterium]|nr:hypothetical protein [Kiritimatiellia bacterium]